MNTEQQITIFTNLAALGALVFAAVVLAILWIATKEDAQ